MNSSKISRDPSGTAFFMLLLTLTIQSDGQTNSGVSTNQFLYQDFAMSEVKLKNGQTQLYLINYNTISEKMAYKKDNKIYDVINPESVDTVFIQGSKFVPVNDAFFEILLVAPMTFFIQHKGELISAGTPAGYGGTSQVASTKVLSSISFSHGTYNLALPPEYNVRIDPVYWVRKDNIMSNFKNQKQFLNLFAAKESELKQFIKHKHIRFDNKSDMVELAGYTNSIVR
ncbi:MAG TPA: hypothetical protein VIK20_07910 [Bacteroidales bacterium]